MEIITIIIDALMGLPATFKTYIFSNELFGGAFLMGIMTATWYQLRNLPTKAYNKIKNYLVFTVTVEERDNLYYPVRDWVFKNFPKKFRSVQAYFRKIDEDLESSSREEQSQNNGCSKDEVCPESEEEIKHEIKYTQSTCTFYIFHKGRFLRVSSERQKIEHAKDLSSLFHSNYTISGFFAKKAINSLLQNCLKSISKGEKKNNIYALRYSDWRRFDHLQKKTLENIFLQDSIKEKIIKSIDNFYNNKIWYEDRNIPYKYGILLHGSPGTGKTSLIKAIANKYRRDIYFLNLNGSDVTDGSLPSIISQIEKGSILVIEDIDSFFKGKRKLTNEKLNFSTLINCLDGIFNAEGILTIFTTNKKLELDPALLRPGRIDSMFDIPLPTVKEVNDYYSKFFNKKLGLKKLRKKWNMAQVQDIFLKNINTPDRVKKLL